MHRINLYELTGGRAVTVYAQHEVLKDLIARRLADGGDVRFGVSDTAVEGITGDRPTIRFEPTRASGTSWSATSSSAATGRAPSPGS